MRAKIRREPEKKKKTTPRIKTLRPKTRTGCYENE